MPDRRIKTRFLARWRLASADNGAAAPARPAATLIYMCETAPRAASILAAP